MSIRTERVGRLLQREIAEILQGQFSDQLPAMTTVTEVRVTRDLSIAYVYVSILEDSDELRKSSIARLVELTPRIRSVLAGRIRHQVRGIPEIKFFLDETVERAGRIDALLDKIHDERAGREGDQE